MHIISCQADHTEPLAMFIIHAILKSLITLKPQLLRMHIVEAPTLNLVSRILTGLLVLSRYALHNSNVPNLYNQCLINYVVHTH